MFENRSYKSIMADIIAQAPKGIDTRQGSIYFDALSAFANIIARNYADLDMVFALIFLTTATGPYLDAKAFEFGVYRHAAVAAQFKYVHTPSSVTPPNGSRFFHSETGLYFTIANKTDLELEEGETDRLVLIAEQAGIAANAIQEGDLAVPSRTITGLATSEFGRVIVSGQDEESDDSLRQRVIDTITGAANGNRAHYKAWCESIDGVGRARVYPLWAGENTVKAVLISPEGGSVDPTVVAAVQEYIDPMDADPPCTVTVEGQTVNVGDGLGNGVANIGAHFLAVSAHPSGVNVEFTAEYTRENPGAAFLDEAKDAVEDALTEYINNVIMNTPTDAPMTVYLARVTAIIVGLTDYFVDCTDLTLNGESRNISFNGDDIPMLGTVTIHADD